MFKRKNEKVGNIRITIGRFGDGEEFIKVEDWKSLAEAHERTDKPWTGATIFADIA